MPAMTAPTTGVRADPRREGAFEDRVHLCGVIGRWRRMTAHRPWAFRVSAVLASFHSATDGVGPVQGP